MSQIYRCLLTQKALFFLACVLFKIFSNLINSFECSFAILIRICEAGHKNKRLSFIILVQLLGKLKAASRSQELYRNRIELKQKYCSYEQSLFGYEHILIQLEHFISFF